MMRKGRVLVIGLDGGSFNILDLMMKRKVMPNLMRLISEASHGDLKSTIPPVTAPAWTSLRTGMNPGKHGIYGFTKPVFIRNDRGYIEDIGIDINDASSISGVKIWNILSEMGKKVGIVSMPFTYPPEEVNGIMVSGFMTTGKRKGATFPENLKKDIINNTGISFNRGIADGTSISREFLKHLIKSVEEKNKMDIYLLNRYKFDFFTTVYQQTDILQHYFMKFIDVSHPDYDDKRAEKFRSLINKFYQTIDTSVGKLIGCFSEDATIMLVSDHGFAPSGRVFYINKYLQDEGFLEVKNHKELILNKVGLSGRKALSILSQLDILNLKRIVSLKMRRSIKNRFLSARLLPIDYEKSIAFFHCNNEQGIYFLDHQNDNFNNKNNELKEKLISKLKVLKDPKTDSKIIKEVYRKEQVYYGQFLDNAPDILIQPNTPYILNSDISVRGLIGDQQEGFTNGQHSPDGIFIIKGPDIKHNFCISGANLVDIMPTILYIFNLPIPSGVDGRVLDAIFYDERLRNYPVEKQEYKSQEKMLRAGYNSAYSEGEKEEIKSRLKELGYI